MSGMNTKNRAQAPARALTMLQLFVIGSLVLAIAIPLSGCGKTRIEGDRNGLRQLQGQRVGLVVRALRYLDGSIEGEKHVQRGARVVVDVPLLAYTLAAYDSDNLEKELSEIFDIVLIGEYVPISDENALHFDGELVLVNPSSQKLQVPFDEGTRALIEEHSLKGIIFVDQDFHAIQDLSLIASFSHVTIVDASGRTVFQREPGGLHEDGRGRFSSFGKDFLREFSFGLMGEATADEVDRAVKNMSSQAAEAVRQAIQTYLSQE